MVYNPRGAVRAAQSIGFPVVVKALGISHKTEHGGVKLDVGSAREASAAATEMSRLAESGSWNPEPFLAAVERRDYSAVLMQRLPWSPIHRTRWTPAMLQRIDRHYEARRRFGHTVVYLPRED